MPFGRFALLNANISAIHNSPNIFLDGKALKSWHFEAMFDVSWLFVQFADRTFVVRTYNSHTHQVSDVSAQD